MRRGFQKIYGGAGALPAWTDYAKAIIKHKGYQEKLDPYDLTVISQKEWPLKHPHNSRAYLVDMPRGIVLREGKSADIEIFNTTNFSLTGEQYINIHQTELCSNGVLVVKKAGCCSSVGRWLAPAIFCFLSRTCKNSKRALPLQPTGGSFCR